MDVLGPGIWRSIHGLGLTKFNQTNIDFNLYIFKLSIHAVINSIPCEMCRTSALIYFQRNQPQISVDEYSNFKWTVDFHNWVNEKLNKKILSYSEALEAQSYF